MSKVMPMLTPNSPCPCGLKRSYEACCGRYHADVAAGGLGAPDPESLMRSRYSAYVLSALGHAAPANAYLVATWQVSKRPPVDELGLAPGIRWLGLHVLSASVEGERGMVEFVARFKIGGASAVRHHERSQFVREHGRWLFLDGEFCD
jgi:SEC-C motif domain protein